MIARFEDGESVDEDWRLAPASLAIGAGMAAPSSPPVDAGVFGDPLGGVPGREEVIAEPLFFVAGSDPAWTTGVPPSGALAIAFAGGAPDPATVAPSVFVVDALGNSLPIAPFVDAGRLIVPAPAGGWSAGSIVEIVPTLASVAGDPLAASTALPIVAP